MDISNFDTSKKSEEGVWTDIFSPDGTEVVFQILIAGRDSKILKKRQIELAKKRQGKRTITPMEEEQDSLKTLATVTLNWRDYKEGQPGEDGFLLEKGKKVECNFDNAYTLYEKYNWVSEQVIEAVADRSRFL